MHAFASYILRGRAQAIIVATITAALSLVLPPLGHISGATIALVALRNGLAEGLIIALGAGVVLGLIGFFSSISLPVVKVFLLALFLIGWIPVLVTAVVLRYTRSLGYVLAVSGGMAAVALLGMYGVVDDVAAWWHTVLETLLSPVLEGAHVSLSGKEIELLLENMSSVMTGFVAAAIVYTTMISLFIARWLQAILYNPGGFRQEFQAMRLGRNMAVLSLLVMAVHMFVSGEMADITLNLLILIVAVYSQTGLALAHAVVASTNVHAGWLVALYVLMLFALPHVMLVLSAAGFADSWLDLRTRFRGRGSGPAS